MIRFLRVVERLLFNTGRHFFQKVSSSSNAAIQVSTGMNTARSYSFVMKEVRLDNHSGFWKPLNILDLP